MMTFIKESDDISSYLSWIRLLRKCQSHNQPQIIYENHFGAASSCLIINIPLKWTFSLSLKSSGFCSVSLFSHSALLSLNPKHSERDYEDNTWRNKHTLLTWLCAVSCRTNFIWKKLQNKSWLREIFISHCDTFSSSAFSSLCRPTHTCINKLLRGSARLFVTLQHITRGCTHCAHRWVHTQKKIWHSSLYVYQAQNCKR